MIHVLTAHVGTPRWIPLQRRCLTRFLPRPHRVLFSLEDIEPAQARGHLLPGDEVVLQRGEHPEKLNALAELASVSGPDQDILLFLDGDALPVAPLSELLAIVHDGVPVAVRRRENAGDPQPHPSFCAITSGLWSELDGDWSPGPTWINSAGQPVSDVGARLWQQLRLQGVDWLPLERSREHPLHPLWFGVYGDAVYHHGAAFRFPFSRTDTTAGAERGAGSADGYVQQVGERSERLGEEIFTRLALLSPGEILPACRSGELFAGLAPAAPH
jgi:hypothetical protein